MNGALAYLMAGLHGALILFLVVGGFLAIRRRRVRLAHVAAIAATGVVYLLGADCPLTVWENHFREAAGWSTHGGFVDHYLLEPLTGATRNRGWIEGLVVAAWVVPTLVAYSVVGMNWYRQAAGGPSSTST